jgi:hypothetical protein
VLRTVEALGEAEARAIHRDHDRLALALDERRVHGVRESLRFARVHPQTIDDDQQIVRGGEVDPVRQLVQMDLLAIGEHAHEAERAEVLDHQRVREPGGARKREADHHPRALREPQHRVHRALHAVGPDLPPARLVRVTGTEGPADAGPEESKIIVDLRRRPHRRSAGLGRVALLDRDRGGDALHPIHVGLLHPLQELLRIGGERLHVASLPLGVDRVEGEGRLPRSGGTGEHDEGPARDVHVQVPEIVLSCAADDDPVFHLHCGSVAGTDRHRSRAAPSDRFRKYTETEIPCLPRGAEDGGGGLEKRG